MGSYLRPRHRRSINTLSRRATASVHADQHATLFQRGQKICLRELRTLIGVPDLGLATAQHGLQRGQTKAGLHGVGEFPTEHEAAEPIITATRKRKPPCIGTYVISVL